MFDCGEREEYCEEEYYECSCGWYGNDPYVLKEFGMIFYICPDCSGEVY